MPKQKLSGREKAALLLILLGPEVSAQIFKHLADEEIDNLTIEIANMRTIADDGIKNEILKEFYLLCQGHNYINSGGIDYAKDLLEKAVGQDKAKEILARVTSMLQVRPFDALRRTDPSQLFDFIKGEHPQTLALILSYLPPQRASQLLSALPQDIQADVSKRVAVMEGTSPDVIKEVELVLEKQLSSIMSEGYTIAGGIEAIVDVLNMVDRGTEKNILDKLSEDDPELAEEIKKRMFVFEDIMILDDRAVQLILRQVETNDLGLALKTASEDVEHKIFKNMTKKAGEMLREDVEYMGPVKLREVEEAQQRIVNVIRQLEEEGDIIIARGGESEVVV